MEEIIERIPSSWTMAPQNVGKGIKFIDEMGFERIRMHGPSISQNIPATSNSRNGWVLRVIDRQERYYDDLGNVVAHRADEGHIPMFGNANL